ncbi:hypothetical protein MYCTH_2305377 [Thermothelomyces thermophilus ATCC 42464]|uniref:Peptidase A1 domain-containing protein n=1 Tax=Thermothelomyces thermophilus (strain ATCC 42464 / BCRC 31852 / DSM 1799) TaxID=573729 RepID=G2QCR4_THET4|nr:uncharacterized protein MYCTH_2305377 [Thermothelomyces thermophilus ATCC 42464]AEO58186.1 hypothetical protein MYCTH_2305377 [Thermothelomyces thermophilus ATCC 42464]
MLFKDGIIQNHSLSLIDSAQQMFVYPGGTWYPIFTGCLSVGAPERFQVFTGDGASRPTLNASMIPWALKDQNMTTSSSFGLHYGSAASAAKMTGSLLYGGYDRNRVVGKMLSIDGDLFKPVTLQDISILVIQGSSPFNSATAISGLLAQGNSSISSAGLPVILDPCSPYLTLPKSTCDSIAAHLPVSYNASLGLYLWNTSSPRYAPVVTSASTLSFTLMGASNTESLTIHVPFRHLSLNLTAPFTATFEPVPYLPCFTGGVGAYALGRAFFQDAFVGANWEKRKVWLAQAPGPNIPAGVDAVSIQPDQDAVVAGGND